RRPITRTLASFHRRAPAAVCASVHRAARTPGTLFAAIDAPVPVQQNSTAVSQSPPETSSPTRRPTSAHSSSSPPGGPTATTSWPRATRASATASVSGVRSSEPSAPVSQRDGDGEGGRARVREMVVDETDRRGALADCRRDALDRSVAHVARREHARDARLERRGRLAAGPAARAEVAPREDVAAVVAFDVVGSPLRVRLAADEDEQR